MNTAGDHHLMLTQEHAPVQIPTHGGRFEMPRKLTEHRQVFVYNQTNAGFFFNIKNKSYGLSNIATLSATSLLVSGVAAWMGMITIATGLTMTACLVLAYVGISALVDTIRSAVKRNQVSIQNEASA